MPRKGTFRNLKRSAKSQSSYSKRSAIRNSRAQFRNAKMYIEPGDQRVTIKSTSAFAQTDSGTSTGATYFHSYSIAKPYSLLVNSPYAGYAKIYSLVRLSSYSVKVSIPGSHKSLPGATASKLFRDIRPTNPNPVYEQLIQETRHKRGKSYTTYKFNWYPIEPSDFEFLQFNETVDSGRYGQINIAGIAFPTPFQEVYKPIIEWTFNYDFKYLIDTTAYYLFSNNTASLPIRLNSEDLENFTDDDDYQPVPNTKDDYLIVDALNKLNIKDKSVYLPKDPHTMRLRRKQYLDERERKNDEITRILDQYHETASNKGTNSTTKLPNPDILNNKH